MALEESFHRRLARELRDMGIGVETINLGVGGYGTLQEYLAFREFGVAYRPELVLLGFYVGNDIRNNGLEFAPIRPGAEPGPARPYVDPDSAEWRVTRIDYENALRQHEARMAARGRVRSTIARNSALYQLASRAKNSLTMFGGSAESVDAGVQEVASADDFEALHGVNYCEEPDRFTGGWSATARILARLRDAVDAVGARLVVFSVPAKEEVDPDYMSRVRDLAPDPRALCLEEAPGHRRLAEVLDRLGIESIDLLKSFRRVTARSGTALFGRIDRHWNAAGHEMAARRVASELAARGLVPRK